jgi:hypothetical protein
MVDAAASGSGGQSYDVSPWRRNGDARASESVSTRCPLYPRKRTLIDTIEKSAKCQKQTSAASLDHLLSKGLIDQFVSAYLTIDAPL